MTNKLVVLKIISSKINDIQLDSVLQTIDRLHDAATSDLLETQCSVDETALVGWLEDIIFTAQETINELQAGQDQEHADEALVLSMMKYRQG